MENIHAKINFYTNKNIFRDIDICISNAILKKKNNYNLKK